MSGTGTASRSRSRSAGTSAQLRNVADLYRGHLRLSVIRDLAMGELSERELAERYKVTAKEVKAFAEDFSQEISEVRAALAGKLAIEAAGLWIAKRQNRLAEAQAEVEDVNEALESLRVSKVAGQGLGSRRHLALVRLKLAALKYAADELSPQRASAGGQDDPDVNMVHYVVEADPETLEALT